MNFEIQNKTKIMTEFDKLLCEVDEIPPDENANKLFWIAKYCLFITNVEDNDESLLLKKISKVLKQLKKKGTTEALYAATEIQERIENMISDERNHYKQLIDLIRSIQKFGPPMVRNMITTNEFHHYVDNEQQLLSNLDTIWNFCNAQQNKIIEKKSQWNIKHIMQTITLQKKQYLKLNLRIWIKESKVLEIL